MSTRLTATACTRIAPSSLLPTPSKSRRLTLGGTQHLRVPLAEVTFTLAVNGDNGLERLLQPLRRELEV